MSDEERRRPREDEGPRPSPRLKIPNMGDTEEDEGPKSITGVYRIADRTALSTKIQWGAIGAVALSIATFVGWAINKMDVVNTASAQTQAKAETALEASRTNSTRIEAVDAGTRAAIENLRKEIIEGKAETDRKLDRILAEVKKK